MKLKYNLSSTVSIALLSAIACAAGQAQAQTAEGEVVVTGSRVIRNGFQAPTPVSVLGAQEIASSGVKDISEFVQELPAVAGSWDLQSRARQGSNGSQGLTSPALRNLGPNRTLILLDGQRSVPSQQTGEVDTSNFPQMLISRVEVVTGGASAAYGSDAVSGVVNYILDKEFTGLKAESSYGVSDYGDNKNWKVGLAGGLNFAGGRGHFMAAGEIYETEGIPGDPTAAPPKRKWQYNSPARIPNPNYTMTNGAPWFIVRPDAGDPRSIKNAALLQCTSGACLPMRGLAIGPEGPFQFNFGTLSLSGTFGTLSSAATGMYGGDWALTEVSSMSTLDTPQQRQGVFSRLSYDLTDNFTVFGQASWNHSYTDTVFCCSQVLNMDIRVSENPFLPDSVRTRAQALGLTVLRFGQYLDPTYGLRANAIAERWVNRYVAGATGDFDAFGSNWSWDGYYQYGLSRSNVYRSENYVTARLTQALRAVRNANGQIVCFDPSNGCVPYNPFGWGVNPIQTVQFLRGVRGEHEEGDASFRHESYSQNVAAAAVSGEPFSLWAGPVSLAFGVEHRKEELKSYVDAGSEALIWSNANFQATNASYNVTEGFVETVVPLLSELPLAKQVEFNGAVRATDYSQSGYVTTWKAGLTWAINDDLRLRATRSRDIRAPNISELFGAGTTPQIQFGAITDPFNGGRPNPRNALQVILGNPDLVPEKADTIGLGAVYQPSFAPGLSFSVDYYKIDVNDSVANTPGGAQFVIDECFAGNTAFCPSIVRDSAGLIERVFTGPINLEKLLNRGVDFEAGYRLPLENVFSSMGGTLDFRWMATHFLEAYTDNGLSTPTDVVGQNGTLPEWRQRYSVTYSDDRISASLSARVASDGKVDNTWIECNSNCPTATNDAETIEVGGNFMPGYVYYDTSFTYKFDAGASRNELFFSIRNLTNRDPWRAPTGGSSRGNRGTSDGFYDMVGRTYQVGLRLRM